MAFKKRKKGVPWSDADHDFLVECAKSKIPFDWVDLKLGRSPRSSTAHAFHTGIKKSPWKGRVPYTKARELRGKFAIICAKHFPV